MIKTDAKYNIFANSNNPLKLFIAILNLLETFKNMVDNMDGILNNVKVKLEDIVLEIIERLDCPGTLKNWLFDDYDDKLKIIDYIGYFELIRILNHRNISKIIEELWNGNIDPNKERQNVLEMAKSSVFGFLFRQFSLNFDSFFSIVSLKHPFAFIKWGIVFGHEIIKEFIRRITREEQLIEGEDNYKVAQHSFPIFLHTLREDYLVEMVNTVIFLVLYIVLAVLMTRNKREMYSTYADIQTLQGQTQTASVLAQIEDKYDDLEQAGNDWWNYFSVLVFLGIALINAFATDVLYFMSYSIRNMSRKTVSRIFYFRALLDLILAIISIITIVRYFTKYNKNDDDYRSEEHKYRAMLKTEGDGFNTNGTLSFILFHLMFRFL